MGLAVLPSRLKEEMNLLANYIINEKDISSNSHIAKQEKWVKDILTHRNDITCDNIFSVLQDEIGKAFIKVLEDAGVYKCTPDGLTSFKKFINTL